MDTATVKRPIHPQYNIQSFVYYTLERNHGAKRVKPQEGRNLHSKLSQKMIYALLCMRQCMNICMRVRVYSICISTEWGKHESNCKAESSEQTKFAWENIRKDAKYAFPLHPLSARLSIRKKCLTLRKKDKGKPYGLPPYLYINYLTNLVTTFFFKLKI